MQVSMSRCLYRWRHLGPTTGMGMMQHHATRMLHGLNDASLQMPASSTPVSASGLQQHSVQQAGCVGAASMKRAHTLSSRWGATAAAVATGGRGDVEPDDSIIHQKILDSINASGNPILPTFHMPTLQAAIDCYSGRMEWQHLLLGMSMLTEHMECLWWNQAFKRTETEVHQGQVEAAWKAANQLAALGVQLAPTGNQTHCRSYINELVRLYNGVGKLQVLPAPPPDDVPTVDMGDLFWHDHSFSVRSETGERNVWRWRLSQNKPAAPAGPPVRTPPQAANMSPEEAAATAASWVAAQQQAAAEQAPPPATDHLAHSSSDLVMFAAGHVRSVAEAHAAVPAGVAAVAAAGQQFGVQAVVAWMRAFLSAVPSSVIQLGDPAALTDMLPSWQLFWGTVWEGLDAAATSSLQHAGSAELVSNAVCLLERSTKTYWEKMGGIDGVHAARLRTAALATLHAAGTRLAEEWARAPPAPGSPELQAAVDLALCVHEYEYSDTYFEKVISFEAGPEWMRDFAATTRSHLHSMNATQLQQLMQALNTSAWEFGPEWLAAWRAAAACCLPHATDDEAASMVYAHGQVAARNMQRWPAAAVDASSVAPADGDQAATLTNAAPGELGHFLAAAAQRLTRLNGWSAEMLEEQKSDMQQYLGNMGKGLQGMQLVLHLLPAHQRAALLELSDTAALCNKAQECLTLLLAPSKEARGYASEKEYASVLGDYFLSFERLQEVLLYSVGRIFSGLVALAADPPPVSLVWQYKRTLATFLPIEYLSIYPYTIDTLNARDFASALTPLAAYKERMAGCSDLTVEEREQINSTDWMEGLEERITIRLNRWCEHGMYYDADCLLAMLRGLRLSGTHWNEVLVMADKDGLLRQSESLSDAQFWALVCELHANGGTEAAAAAAAAARGHPVVLPSAPEGAHAEYTAHLQERTHAMAQRVARYLATLSVEQRTAAIAHLDAHILMHTSAA